MRLLPDSPPKLAVWLVVLILITDTAGLPLQFIALVAIVFAGLCGWLIFRRRRTHPKSGPFLGTTTPLYTYGLLCFGAASVLALLGLVSTGFDIISRLVEWNWEGFGLSSLEPLAPALVLASVSILLISLHTVLHLNDGEEP